LTVIGSASPSATSSLLNAPLAAIVLITVFTIFNSSPILLKGMEKAVFWPIVNSRKKRAHRPSSDTRVRIFSRWGVETFFMLSRQTDGGCDLAFMLTKLPRYFTPIINQVLDPGVIWVRADSPYKTLHDLIDALWRSWD
jgi:hypothetical protein